jgi:hypothetical protein
MTKEEIYDEQINPLMAKIIEICKEHKIANVISFSLDLESGLCCTSCMTTDEYDPPEDFKRCVEVLFPPMHAALMVTVRDGDGTVKEMHAVID